MSSPHPRTRQARSPAAHSPSGRLLGASPPPRHLPEGIHRPPPMPGRVPGTGDARLLAVALGIMTLSFADAALTLTLMGTGQVTEWNPFLAALIERDLQLFANVKMGFTGGGVLLLAGIHHARLRYGILVRRILEAVCLGYVVVTLYHLTLFHRTGLLPV